MNNLDIFKKQKQIKPYIDAISKFHNILVVNSTQNHNVLLSALTFQETSKSVIYVCENLYKATLFYETITNVISTNDVHLFVTDEMFSTEAMAVSNEFRFERMHTICSIIKNKKKIIVTTINSFLRPLIPKQVYIDSIINIKSGDTIDITSLARKLITFGYIRTSITDQTGSFSIRGEVFDIYPLNSDFPFRINLFDNEVENIKTFNPLTQLSIKKVDEIEIMPITELIYDDYNIALNLLKKDIKNDFNDNFKKDIEDITNHTYTERLYKYIKYFYKETYNLFDYINDATIMFDNYTKIKENYEKNVEEYNMFISSNKHYINLGITFFDDINVISNTNNKLIYLSNMKQSLNDIYLDKIISIDAVTTINYQNNILHFIEDIKTSNKTFLIVLEKEVSKNYLLELFKVKGLSYNEIDNIDNIKEKEINIIIDNNYLSFGFINGIEVITEDKIFKTQKYKNTKYRSIYQNTTSINSKDDLKPGDYIVHYDYGIGLYRGIESMELKGVTNDYLSIKFSNTDLFVPIERINLIEKYQGSEGSIPSLSTIGTKEWEKKKEKISKKIESIAKDLIDIQASRQSAKGYQYAKDEEIQIEFENDFEYEPTEDQKNAVDTIKKDMEDGVIIDRLVCGDVGYGKTEVAIRIAMKTVLNNKQVAYLAPTTILTRQHYQTFKERFDKYGVRVELINRLVSIKDQNRIIKDLKSGMVDIVIGTHSLLNDEIKYKDLGLLIIDEEQRFGVTHKEKIKKLKENINVLTLTATPIPRTLQMSIMGVRQLSLMETPPQNRYPVQTYVIEKNETIIREAIYRELGRGGQVFYLHNKIEDLDLEMTKIHRLVPEAKIIMAHGRMKKEDLEDAIQSFIDKEYDILICTTIIETGIDIPNTNTLIVDMSDYLGLSQMYQIRGRVGRSDRVSYAYFMYQKGKVLTDQSSKRLEAIKEFTTLGSGYKIAVRDLAIRGCGDILGKEQSGFIDTIGLDLYMKILNDAINKEKGLKEIEEKDYQYKVNVSKHISNSYVSDDDIKIFIHKAIKSIENNMNKEKIKQELIDRFGELTIDISKYIDKEYLTALAKKIGIEKINDEHNYIEIVFEKNASINAKELFMESYKVNKNYTFKYERQHIYMQLNKMYCGNDWVKDLITIIENILKKCIDS